jgi:hypothetical protein
MDESVLAESDSSTSRERRQNRRKRIAFIAAIVLTCYVAAAYFVLPSLWREYAHHHPALDDVPGITLTADDHPGDPINVALIGTQESLETIMLAGGWFPADRLGLRSDLKIAADAVLSRPYDDAPVSSLYLWGRKEDLAFEQPVGDNPRQRHHVRFWKSAAVDAQGRPLWVGSVTYDERVGLSHTTGQVTHHISPEIDMERSHLFESLTRTGRLSDVTFIDDFHQVREGRNGGGDRWFTDGRLAVGTIEVMASGAFGS